MTRTLNDAIKKLERIKRKMPYSHEKKKKRVQVLFYEVLIRKKKGNAADERIMEKRSLDVEIDITNLSNCTIENLKKMLEDKKLSRLK